MSEQTEREFLHEMTNIFSVAHGSVNLLKTIYDRRGGLEKNEDHDLYFKKACRALEELREVVTTRHNHLRELDRRKQQDGPK